MSRPISTNMTNSLTSEARSRSASGFAALLAALLAAVAIAASIASPAPASAAQASGEQVSVSMPTEVPCALMADGTVVAPSSWAVRNEGNVPARLSGASASANYGGLSFSATYEGAVLLKHSNGSASFDATLLVPASGSLPITWSVSKVDPSAHPDLAAAAARGPVDLLSASFSFRGQAAAPAVSVTGQRVCMQALSASPTALPAGAQVASAKWYASDSASGPWAEIAGAGSASLSLGKDLIGKYVKCRLEYSGGDFDVPASESAACGPIAKAPATLSATISGEAKEGATLFAAVDGLPADSTAEVSVTWQMSDDGKGWTDFAAGETIVLGAGQVGKYVRCVVSAGDDAVYAVASAASSACGPVKAKQAFAVYSADDNSLNFYKRFDVPAAGSTFEGKTVTSVYTGIENSDYSDRSAVPWADRKPEIVSATAVDEISPKSMAWWFAMMDVKDPQGNFCAPLARVDLAKVDTSSCESMAQLFCKAANLSSIKGVEGWDTSSCTTMKGIFNGTAVGSLNLSGWDTSRVSDMSMAFMSCTHLTDLDVSGWDTSSCTTMRKLFSFCRSLASLDVSGWDTSSCVTMRELFYYCSSLTSLDVSKWNTSKVTDLYYTFSNCKSLTSLDVSGWDTSSCTTMRGLFSECISLTSLDLSGWSVSNVADLSFMCATVGNKYMKLTTVGDLSAWDTSKNTSLAAMFQDCEYLESIGDISGWDTSKVTSMHALFNRCVRLDGIGDLSGWDVSSSKSFDYTFCGKGMTKTGMEIDASFVRSWDVSSAVDFDGMFKCCTAQEELDLSKWNVSGAETASEMFNGMTGLKKVSLPASWKWLDGGYLPVPSADYIDGADGLWHAKSDGAAYAPKNIPSGKADTYYAVAPKQAFAVYSDDDGSLNFYKRSAVPAAGEQFEDKTATAVYTGIETSDYSDRSAVPWADRNPEIVSATAVDEISPKSMAYWFAMTDVKDPQGNFCAPLARVDLAKVDTSRCVSMRQLFSKAVNLAAIDGIEKWDTSNVTDMHGMFQNCKSLTSLDVSGWDTSKATSMYGMFYGCSSLPSLDVSGFDTSNVTDMTGMFNRCSSLASLDVSHFDTSKVAGMNAMFYGCSSLASLDVSHFDTSKATDMSYMFYGCTKLQEVTFGSAWKWVGTHGFLPAPSSSYIDGADGLWHAKSDGAAYAPKDVPSDKADTYYASKPLRDAVVGSGDEDGDADEIAPIPAQEQGVAARSLPADGEDEASAAPSVEVSLELAGDGSRAAGPVAVTLSGDAGDARAVLSKEGAKVALAPGRYLVSCLPAPEADGSMADTPAPFWIEASEGMEPVEIAIGSASRRPAADVQARAAAIESWLAAAAGSVPEADAEALRSAEASALSACKAAEAGSEASEGSE